MCIYAYTYISLHPYRDQNGLQSADSGAIGGWEWNPGCSEGCGSVEATQ